MINRHVGLLREKVESFVLWAINCIVLRILFDKHFSPELGTLGSRRIEFRMHTDRVIFSRQYFGQIELTFWEGRDSKTELRLFPDDLAGQICDEISFNLRNLLLEGLGEDIVLIDA